MNNVLTVSDKEKEIYNIYFNNDFSGLKEVFHQFQLMNRRICIVSDSNVSRYYLSEVQKELSEIAGTVTHFVFEAGEASKNMETAQKLYENLILNQFDRNDMLVALGGGVVGDLTGFVAATYLRGIRFVQVPTSLLAMVDSSVGGKTGVDFMCYKNMVGAFHQPLAVYMNISALKTLTEEHYYNGFAEIIKYGMIQDASFLSWIADHIEEIQNHDEDVLKNIVYRSCHYKREIVQRDAKENNERALLNYGHTIGHSIEKNSDFMLLHGQCVALGMVAALYMDVKRGKVLEQELDAFENLLKVLKLPIRIQDMDSDTILEGTKNDKKMEAGSIRFILLNGIGNGYIDNSVTDEEMLGAISYLMK